MYFQKVINRKTVLKKLVFVGVLKVITKIAGSGSASDPHHADPDQNPDPLIRGMDCGPWIHTKLSWILNTG
jgi:hypothetical protein